MARRSRWGVDRRSHPAQQVVDRRSPPAQQVVDRRSPPVVAPAAARRSRWGVLRRPPAEDRRNGVSRSAGRRTGRLLATAGHLLAHRTHRAPLAQPVRPSPVAQARLAHCDGALQIARRRDVASCRLDRAVRNARPLACVDGQASLDPFILFDRRSGSRSV